MIQIKQDLKYLKLSYMAANFDELCELANDKNLDRMEFLEELIQAEKDDKKQRLIQRRIKSARLGTIKLLEDFKFSYPKSLNEEQVRHHFRLGFMKKALNIIFIGTVGLGKTHLTKAMCYKACLDGSTVLFTTAVEIINNLTAAHEANRLEAALKAYTRPQLLAIDELGYIPLDKHGCNLLFQVISRRYENSSTIITSNRPYSHWQEIFNNDAVVTSAVLDRLLHHSDTITIEGNSYRMKDVPREN